MPRTATGFTLVEILVVLVIAVSVLVIVPPMFSKVIESTQLKTSARNLASALKSTRVHAIKTQRDATLTLDLENHTYRSRQRKRTLPKSLKLSLLTSDAEQLSENVGAIRFYPDGSSSGGRITLAANGTEFRITVDWLTGGVSISP